MGRPQLAVRYKRIAKYWYYKTPEMSCFKTTGQTTKTKAQKFVLDSVKNGTMNKKNPQFKLYAEPYFIWGKCPHVQRLY